MSPSRSSPSKNAALKSRTRAARALGDLTKTKPKAKKTMRLRGQLSFPSNKRMIKKTTTIRCQCQLSLSSCSSRLMSHHREWKLRQILKTITTARMLRSMVMPLFWLKTTKIRQMIRNLSLLRNEKLAFYYCLDRGYI